MNSKKLISYFGTKSKSLNIESYWKEGIGTVSIEMNPVNLNTSVGQEQMKAMLHQMYCYGAKKVCLNGAQFGIMELLLAPELHKNQGVNYEPYNTLDPGIKVIGTTLIEGNLFTLKPDGKKYMVIKKEEDQIHYQKWGNPLSVLYTRSLYSHYFTCLPF